MERKDMKLGFIGFGNMAQAIAEGLLRSKALEPEQICACAKDWDKLCAATQPRGMRPCRDAREVAEAADVVIVAVKPHLIEEVLSPVRGQLAVRQSFPWRRAGPSSGTRRCYPERAI